MKAQLIAPDGTIIELEGTPDEIERFVDMALAPALASVPYFQHEAEGCSHMYPNPWHGVVPPPCMKCGQIPPDIGFTWTTSDG